MLKGVRVNNIFMIELHNLDSSFDMCVMTTLDESRLWHRRLCHASMHTLKKITPFGLVMGVIKLKHCNDLINDVYMHD